MAINRLRVFERPVGQDHRVVPVVGEGLRVLRLDHQGAVSAGLLLEPRVAVIPVRAGLLDMVAVLVGLARLDAVEVNPRHPIHAEGHQDAVPVKGGMLGVHQMVGHVQGDILALPQVHQRPGNRTVDGGSRPLAPVDMNRRITYGKIVAVSGGHLPDSVACAIGPGRQRQGKLQTRQKEPGPGCLDKIASCHAGVVLHVVPSRNGESVESVESVGSVEFVVFIEFIGFIEFTELVEFVSPLGLLRLIGLGVDPILSSNASLLSMREKHRPGESNLQIKKRLPDCRWGP